MPIRDLLQDAAGDLAVVDGDFAVAGGDTDEVNLAAVQQGVGIRLRMLKGECFLDESKGVDYFGKILRKNPDPNTVRTELSVAITSTPDVLNVTDAGLVEDGATRMASIDYTIRTAYSTTPVTGTVATP